MKNRDETMTQNLKRLMKREVIKQQCWDSMAIKGRCIEVVAFFFSDFLTENFNYFLQFRVLQVQIVNRRHQLLKIIHYCHVVSKN